MTLSAQAEEQSIDPQTLWRSSGGLGVKAPILLGSAVLAGWSWLAFFRGYGLTGALKTFALELFTFFAISYVNHVVVVRYGVGSVWLRRNIARCSLAFSILLLFLPEYASRVQPPHIKSALLLTIACALWIALCISVVREYRSESNTKEAGLPWISVGIILAIFVAVTIIAIRKIQVFGYVGQDVAYFAQIMYTTLHGHLFWGSLLQDLLYSKPVYTDFAGHNSPIQFLFLPFYAVAPHPVTLLLIRNVTMVLCSTPIYRIARRYTTRSAAALWPIVFLLTPAIFYQSTFDFYPLSFVALPLLFALYYYLEFRLAPFCISLALTLAVREDLALFSVALALVALVQRRRSQWVLIPATAGISWGMLSYLYVLPSALHGASFVTDACFSHLGNSPASMIASVCSDPKATVLTHNNIVYLKELFTPAGLLLAAGNPIALTSIPFIGINLLAGAGHCITTVIFAQYSAIPATLLFVCALLVALKKGFLSKIASLGLETKQASALVMIAIAAASLVLVTEYEQLDELRTKPWTAEAKNVVSVIPSWASVAAPRYMLPYLANRDCLYQTQRLSQYHHATVEYLVLDKDWSHINASSEYAASYARLLKESVENPNLQVIYKTSQYTVLRNPSAAGKGCSREEVKYERK